MAIEAKLTNGTGVEVAITQDRELCVISAPYPPLVEQKVQPFRQYLTDDGLAAGTNNMGVNGAVTNVDYYIASDPSCDRYITSLNFLVAYGAIGKPYVWADGAALTNGTRLFYENMHAEVDIHDGIKTNQDLFRLSFTNITAAWEVRHVNANNDYGYFISMDITKLGLPFGIKLDRGSTQRLTCRIRDDATAAITFNAIGYGFDRFE